MSDELPPLPPPGLQSGPLERRDRYSADQMRAYARAARAQVWREAAEVCDGFDVCDPQHIAREFRARAEKERG